MGQIKNNFNIKNIYALLESFLVEKKNLNHVGIDPIDLAGSKIIWMTGKNII
jgi:hypothetical protein